MNEDKCPTCGKRTLGKIAFNSNLARVFVLAVQRAKDQVIRYRWPKVPGNKTWTETHLKAAVTCEDFKRDRLATEYTIMAKLKYFGLIRQRDEFSRQGIYEITPDGFNFLRGRFEVPTYVMVAKTEVVAKSAVTVNLRQALATHWFDISDWIIEWCNTHGEGQGEFGF
jgi:hypothetical protein